MNNGQEERSMGVLVARLKRGDFLRFKIKRVQRASFLASFNNKKQGAKIKFLPNPPYFSIS